MNKAKLAIGVFLIFFMGMCAGYLGRVYYFKYLENKLYSGELNVDDRSFVLLKKLSERLDLTEVQKHEVNKIIQESEQETFNLRRNYLPEMQAITERSLLLIKQKLNTDQIQKLDDLNTYLEDLHNRAAAELILTEKTAVNELLKNKSLLNLTPDQKENFQKIIEEYKKTREEIINDYNKGGDSGFIILKREISLLDNSIEGRLLEILSEDQMKIYMKAQEPG